MNIPGWSIPEDPTITTPLPCHPPPPTANVQRFSANPAAPPRPAYTAQSMHTVPGVQHQQPGMHHHQHSIPPPVPVSSTSAVDRDFFAAAGAGSGGGGGYGSNPLPAPVQAHAPPPMQRHEREIIRQPEPSWSTTARPATSDGPGPRSGSAAKRQQQEREQQFSKTFTSGDAGDMLAALPSQIRASLKTFEELQMQKNHLMTSSTRMATQKGPLTPPIVGGKTTARSSSTGRMGPLAEAREASRREKEFQKKIELSESVMKKLHKRNQKLAKEVSNLKDELDVACKQTGHVPGAPTPAPAPAAAPAAPAGDAGNDVAATAALAKKDERIRELENRVRLLESRQRQDDSSSTAHQHLQAQYNELLDSHIDSVTNSVSTSKINSEVKAFFITLRKKIHTDLLDREVERGLWNEKMAELEERLCEQYAQSRLEQVGTG